MNEDDNKDRIDKLNEGLYTPGAPEVNKIIKRGINVDEQKIERANEIRREWDAPKTGGTADKLLGWTKREQPIFKKLLWFALGFFILCLAFATFVYLRGVNTVSADKIDIDVSAPLSVSASNPFGLDVTVTNRNNSDLSDAELLVNYPDGSRTVEDNTKPMVEDSLELGPIKQNELVKKHSEAILFGQEGQKEEIKVTLNYKVPGSTSVFSKTTMYEVTINSAPVTVSVNSVKELNSGQDLDFDIKVTSNSDTVLKNIAVRPNYPFGFTFESSDPEFATSTFDSPTWIIDELAPAESKEFKLTGKLTGEKDEDKYFKFQIGSLDPTNPQKIATDFVDVDQLVVIQLPFISSDIKFTNGAGSDNDSVHVGYSIQGDINYHNNLATDVSDLELDLALKDPQGLIDKNNIQVNKGFYSSVNNMITWNEQTVDDFEKVSPGDSGDVTFSLPFSSLSGSSLSSGSLKNLTADLELTIRGKRLSDENVPEEITLLDSRTIKVGTEATIAAKALYTSGPFKNTGGIPPEVNKSTTYTAVLSLSNSLNDVKNAVVTATLPPYVTFEGSFSPTTEQVTYNKTSNVVTWNVGTLLAGQGYKNDPRSLAFKIILTPSANQEGTIPITVDKINLQGTDAFTNEAINTSAESLTTTLLQDPGFSYGEDKINE